MAQINRKQTKLVEGPHTEAMRKRAMARLGEILRLKELNADPDSGKLTVAAVIDLYLEHAKTKYAERSLYERRLILQAFAERHGWRKVNDRDCLPFHLTSFIDGNPNWKSDWTKAQVVAVVHRPFNWAAKQRLIAANPFRGVSQRTGQPRRPMTEEEFNRLVKAAEGRITKKRPTPGERFIEFIRFLRITGARTKEAARLKWADIDLETALITLQRHKTSSQQRQPKPRIIPLVAEVVSLLIEIRKRKEPSEFVFLNHRGTTWNRSSLSLRMQRAREKAGIPNDSKLYGLRHAFGTRAIVNGVDLKTLAELMGHESTRTTEHYLHLAGQKAHLHSAMQKANAPNPGSEKRRRQASSEEP
jgi:site-specific recombinase XerD